MALVGSCAHMCPRAEVLARSRTGEISRFERAPSASATQADDVFGWAVKKYRRAAAGQGDADLSQLRPPRVLLETLQHLMARVLPWRGCGFDWRGVRSEEEEEDKVSNASPADFLALYHFVSDRVRSVRKDLTVQRVDDASAVEVLETSARFYILAGFRARQLLSPAQQREGDWSETLNEQQLASALAQLHELYRKQVKVGGGGDGDDARASPGEFVAYDILLHVDDPRAVSFMLVKVPADTRRSAPVKRALALFVALQTQDFYGFLRGFERATVLEKGLLLKHLPLAWRTGVQAMNKAFGKLDKFTLTELAAWLRLGGPDTALSEFIRFKVTPLHTDIEADMKQRLVLAAAQSIHTTEVSGRLAAPALILNEARA